MPSRLLQPLIPALLLSVCGTAAAVDVVEGRWETKVRVKVAGITLPAPFKTEKCITMGDLVPNSIDAGSQCTIEDVGVSGNEVSWTVHCVEPRGVLRGHAVITYAGSTLVGAMEMVARDSGGELVSTSLYEMIGERKGDCE